MLGQFGAAPLVAMFQCSWVTTAITTRAAWNCAITRTGVGVLKISLSSLPQTVLGATTENTTGVSDSTILVQTQQFGAAAEEVNIVYGPNATGPALNANDIQLTLTVGVTPTDPTLITFNGVVWSCQDGSFTPELP
jgi:hypothetical protein